MNLLGECIPELGAKGSDMLGVAPGMLVNIDHINLSRTMFELHPKQATCDGRDKAEGSWVHNSTGYDSENASVAVIFGLGPCVYEVVLLILPGRFKSPFSFLDYDDVMRGLFNVKQQLVVESAA